VTARVVEMRGWKDTELSSHFLVESLVEGAGNYKRPNGVLGLGDLIRSRLGVMAQRRPHQKHCPVIEQGKRCFNCMVEAQDKG